MNSGLSICPPIRADAVVSCAAGRPPPAAAGPGERRRPTCPPERWGKGCQDERRAAERARWRRRVADARGVCVHCAKRPPDPGSASCPDHINPGKAKHGLRNPKGPDNGDLPNQFAAADGTAKAEFFTTLVSVSGGDMPALLDGDGSAVIIHENPDDHMTQPIGGAGGRIGCGIIGRM